MIFSIASVLPEQALKRDWTRDMSSAVSLGVSRFWAAAISSISSGVSSSVEDRMDCIE